MQKITIALTLIITLFIGVFIGAQATGDMNTPIPACTPEQVAEINAWWLDVKDGRARWETTAMIVSGEVESFTPEEQLLAAIMAGIDAGIPYANVSFV